MSNPGADKWRPIAISNPSTRLRMAHSMPHWALLQQQRNANQNPQRPPTPPKVPPPSLSGDCGDPDYEIIEFPPQNPAQKNAAQKLSPGMPNGSGGRKCALCGTEAVAVRCNTCGDSYCETCDEVNHKHPKRRGHIRRRISAESTANSSMVKPPLPPKGETANPPPVPPPRRNRRNNQARANQAVPGKSMIEKMAGLKLNAESATRPLPSVPDLKSPIKAPQQNFNATPADVTATGTDKMSTLQERYRRYQEAMRAQDANRRRAPMTPTDPSRDSMSPRPSSIGSPRSGFMSPPPPPRSMIQSASVCDLTVPNMWNPPGMQQAQSMSHLANPFLWYPHGHPWESQLGGSTMSLNHPPPMWNYPMGYPQSHMLPPHYPATLSRAHSPARSIKSGRRSRAPSPSPSIKSKKSTTSRSRMRRSPSSSDASSENSDESDFDDRLSRGSRSARRDTFSRGKPSPKFYPEEDRAKSRRGAWKSEDRISSLEDQWSDTMSSRRGSSSRPADLDDRKPTRRYDPDSDRRMRRAPSVDSSSDVNSRQTRPSRTQSTDDEQLPPQRRSSFTRSRPKPASSSEDNDRMQLQSSKVPSRLGPDFDRRPSRTSDPDRGRPGCVRGVRVSESESETRKTPRGTRILSESETETRKTPRGTRILSESETETRKVRERNGSVSREPPPEPEVEERKLEVVAGETSPWACEHCTFINEAKLRVCAVCCKTRSSALPPPSAEPEEPEVAASKPEEAPEKARRAEESDGGPAAKSKGRFRRKISFSFGTKSK